MREDEQADVLALAAAEEADDLDRATDGDPLGLRFGLPLPTP